MLNPEDASAKTAWSKGSKPLLLHSAAFSQATHLDPAWMVVMGADEHEVVQQALREGALTQSDIDYNKSLQHDYRRHWDVYVRDNVNKGNLRPALPKGRSAKAAAQGAAARNGRGHEMTAPFTISGTERVKCTSSRNVAEGGRCGPNSSQTRGCSVDTL